MMHTTATIASRLHPQPSPLPPPPFSSSPYHQRTHLQAYTQQRHSYNNAALSAVYSSNKHNLTLRGSTSPSTVTIALTASKEQKADSEKMGRSRGRSQQVSRAALARKASEERRVKGETENRGRGAEMESCPPIVGPACPLPNALPPPSEPLLSLPPPSRQSPARSTNSNNITSSASTTTDDEHISPSSGSGSGSNYTTSQSARSPQPLHPTQPGSSIPCMQDIPCVCNEVTTMRDCDYYTSCDEDKDARAGMGKKCMDWGMGIIDFADSSVMGVGMGTRKHISTASAISATTHPFPPAAVSRTSPSTMHSVHMSPASTPSTTSPATRSTTPQVESLSTSTSGMRHYRVAEFPPSASPSHLSHSSPSSSLPPSTSCSSNAITFDEVRKSMRGPLFLLEPTLDDISELDFKSYSDGEEAIVISSALALTSRQPLGIYGKEDAMKRKRKRKQGLLLRSLLYGDGEKEEKAEENGLGKKGVKGEVTAILEEDMGRCRRCRKEYLVEMNTPQLALETPLQYSALFAAPISGAVNAEEDAGDTEKDNKRLEPRRSGLWLSLVSKSCLQPSLTLVSTSSTFLDPPSSSLFPTSTLTSPSLPSSSLAPTPTPSSPSPSSSSLSSDSALSSTSSASSLVSTSTSFSSLITTPTSSPCTSPQEKEYLTSGIVDEPLLNTNNSLTAQGVQSRFSGFSLRSWFSPSELESSSPLDRVDFDTPALPGRAHDDPELLDHHSQVLKGSTSTVIRSEGETCSCYRQHLRQPRTHLPFSSNEPDRHRRPKLERIAVTLGDCPLSTTIVHSTTTTTNLQSTQTPSFTVPRSVPSLSLGRVLSSHLVTVGKVLQQFKQFHSAYVGAVAGFVAVDGGDENEAEEVRSGDRADARDWLLGAQGVGMGRGMGGVMYGVGVRRGVGGGGLRSRTGYSERTPDDKVKGTTKGRGRGRVRIRRKKSGYRAKKEDVASVFPPQLISPPSIVTAAMVTMKEVAVSRAAAGFRSTTSYDELDNSADVLHVLELTPLARRTTSTSSSASSRGRRRLTSSTSFVASSSYSPYNPNSLHPPSSSSSPTSSRSSSRTSSTSTASKSSYSPYAHSTDHILSPTTSTPTTVVKTKTTTPIYLRPIANPVYLRLKAVQNVVREMTYGTGDAIATTVVEVQTTTNVAGDTVSSGLDNPLLRDTTTTTEASSGLIKQSAPDITTERKVNIEDNASALALGLLRAGAMGSGRERVCGVGGGGRRRSLLGMGSLCAGGSVECY